ncbi:P-loop NTPase [Zhaonella formicivorans]|jgi:CO dehydrogenase maturation factor|uniref:ATP-binding protein n=1 Tax=Zhaonella formicivorans TaxID=2528593 RepID=UPI0010D549EF|nr:P-loop NTPase [Zhaonella formicivorans]
MKIAVAGKGGVGKTTVSAELAKYFAQEGFTVFAVDADPDLSLGYFLGFPEELILKLRPLVEMREDILAQSGGKGAFYTLNPDVDELLAKYVLQKENIKFLKMGGLKRGGTECYCRENAVLRAVISNLLLEKKEIVILDMGAGIEHLTRGTSEGVDLMLIVTEPTKTSVQSAKVIAKLAEELGIKNIQFIGNKVHCSADYEFLKQNFASNLALVIDYEEEVLKESRGEVVQNKKLTQAIVGLGELLLRRVAEKQVIQI